MSATQPVRAPRRRAPRNSLNTERILDAAITLLDRDGTEAFTMRALAEQLGVGTMAVYSHFRGKEEIADAVAQRLLETIELPPPGDDPVGELRAVCRQVYQLFTDHPSALQLLTVRPLRGDDAISVIDRMLALLCRAGLTGPEAACAHVALMQYTVGSALWNIRRARALCEEGMRERMRAKFAALPADRYPSLVALAPELNRAHDDGPGQYEVGLDALLAGVLGAPGRDVGDDVGHHGCPG
ncbi:TetR/AcrR family transcriptional regulator [Actinacidiphila acididurans]|uniref:TetR/AcrR family transcriptional regulator C-terminal domain-containing protein n=1 Tax=Actinacidiphila acididurans TaxID=2784346 RepID=A0ABS2U0N2_9ACTN|nr:TetR/AcrR family transcriptional regulator C-terminal domain-containing protein [Actinacidiphila acididurans]MBM9508756.1 TetR/AcrR family transcriptional regulator C-terminal domain-containing protein [Actinacidiphila acididurans]